jgi:DNA (cytosine-5)-methyltransferase 1
MISPTERTKDSRPPLLRGRVGEGPGNDPTNDVSAVVVDLCCGMGGLSLAARQLGMRVAVGVDVNTQVARTFSKNFPGAEFIQGSVRSIRVLRRCSELLDLRNGSSIPSVAVSGPPCQGFSAAGSRDAVDPRNQILVGVARAIAELKPRCALVENVAMVLAKKHRNRLKRFEETLAEAGYFVHSLLLDAADFGVAQKRKRAFFLITPTILDKEQVQGRLEQLKQPELSVKTVLKGLPRPEVRPDRYDDEDDRGAFANHLAMRHSKRVMEKIAALKPGTGPMSYRRLHPSRPSKTLFSGHRAPPAHFRDPRSITVREAARLQGFPDCFRVYGSFANQMEQVTNAVPPPLAKTVLQVLAEFAGIPVTAHA